MNDWKWLESTLELQRRSFGIDPPSLEGDAFADYVTWNTTAMVSEIGELLHEVGWKVWAQPRGWVNRDEALNELVDVTHFVANITCALGCTDEEWEERYQAKQLVNAKRQADGYSSIEGKCESCHRDLATVPPIPLVKDNVQTGWVCRCGKVLPL